MPVSVPNPRRRAPTEHHTVGSIREMLPPPPEKVGGPRTKKGEPIPPPPPAHLWPPQWPSSVPPPPPPSFPPPPPGWMPQGYPAPPAWHAQAGDAEEEEEEEWGSPGNQDDVIHPHLKQGRGPPMMPFPIPQAANFPPPPPGWMPPAFPPGPGFPPGMPPPPPGWAPPPGYYPPEAGSPLASPATARRSVRRRSGAEREGQERVEFDRIIGGVRGTSPSRRQIARLQRLVDSARESQVSHSLQPQLSAEQQTDLGMLQERHRRMVDAAQRRQRAHEEEVAEMRAEERQRRRQQRNRPSSERRSRSAAGGASPKTRATTPRARVTSQHEEHGMRGGRYTHTSVVAQTPRGDRMRSDVHTQQGQGRTPQRAKRKAVKAKGMDGLPHTPSRHAAWVEAAHRRLMRSPGRSSAHEAAAEEDTMGHAGDAHSEDAVAALQRAQVSLTTTRGRESPRSPTGTFTVPRRGSANRKSEMLAGPPTSQFLGGPGERDYIEGLEDLHQKLRRTYLEIRKHPQRFLSQLTLQGTIGDPAAPTPAESLADLGKAESGGGAKAGGGQLREKAGASAESAQARIEMERLEAQWEQLLAAGRGDDALKR